MKYAIIILFLVFPIESFAVDLPPPLPHQLNYLKQHLENADFSYVKPMDSHEDESAIIKQRYEIKCNPDKREGLSGILILEGKKGEDTIKLSPSGVHCFFIRDQNHPIPEGMYHYLYILRHASSKCPSECYVAESNEMREIPKAFATELLSYLYSIIKKGHGS